MFSYTKFRNLENDFFEKNGVKINGLKEMGVKRNGLKEMGVKNKKLV